MHLEKRSNYSRYGQNFVLQPLPHTFLTVPTLYISHDHTRIVHFTSKTPFTFCLNSYKIPCSNGCRPSPLTSLFSQHSTSEGGRNAITKLSGVIHVPRDLGGSCNWLTDLDLGEGRGAERRGTGNLILISNQRIHHSTLCRHDVRRRGPLKPAVYCF